MAQLRHSRITPEYRWNPEINHGRGGYIDDRGRVVSPREVRAALDKVLDAQTDRARELAENLRDKKISRKAFQEGMKEVITDAHLAGAAAAHGGWARMTDADYGRLGPSVRTELRGRKGVHRGLAGIMADIKKGMPLDGRFVRRAMQYAQAGRHEYHVVDRKLQREAGMDECRSIRHASDSCDECIEEAGKGWKPVDEIVLPGDRECLRNCHCDLEYRKGGEGDRLEELTRKAQAGDDLSEPELRELARGVAREGFGTKQYQKVKLRDKVAGLQWEGREVKVGDRLPTAAVHYLKHVVKQEEWPPGTTYEQYQQHMREVITDPNTGILASRKGGRFQITFVAPSGDNKGPGGHPYTIVDFRPSTGSVMTCFQPKNGRNQTRGGRSERRWLREGKKTR